MSRDDFPHVFGHLEIKPNSIRLVLSNFIVIYIHLWSGWKMSNAKNAVQVNEKKNPHQTILDHDFVLSLIPLFSVPLLVPALEIRLLSKSLLDPRLSILSLYQTIFDLLLGPSIKVRNTNMLDVPSAFI